MKQLVAALALLTLSGSIRAQQDPAFVHYWAVPSYYNPAAAARGGLLDVNLMYSMQMTGFEGAPATMLATADLPLFFISNAHAVGLTFLNDKLGFFSHMRFAFTYAYHQRIGRKGTLSAGLRAGLASEDFNGSELDLIDEGDPAFPTGQSKGSGFDLDCGLRYDHANRWYVGVTMMHITSPTVSLGEEKLYEYRIVPAYNITGGWHTALRNRAFHFYADAIVRTDLNIWRGDLAARLQYEGEKINFYIGAACSPTNSVTLLVGTRFHDINIGYAYEAYTTSIGMLHGNHEITIGYQMDMSRFKKGRNMHKSVRYL